MKSGTTNQLARRIVRHKLVEITQYMRPNVESDNIHQPEARAFGQSDQRTRNRVHFFNGEIALDRQPVHHGAEERAQTIGDEVWRVLARHRALAKVQIAKL